MPRYYFDTDDGERRIRDDGGIDIDSQDIEQETLALLRDLAHAEILAGKPRVFTATVRDGGGRVVYRGTMTLQIERRDDDGGS